jgi:hypothetical protein
VAHSREHGVRHHAASANLLAIDRRHWRLWVFASTLNEGQQVQYEEVANKGKTSAENLKVK